MALKLTMTGSAGSKLEATVDSSGVTFSDGHTMTLVRLYQCQSLADYLDSLAEAPDEAAVPHAPGAGEGAPDGE